MSQHLYSFDVLLESLQDQANPERAAHSQRFFKTGKGEYGEGDVFLGLTVPAIRQLALDVYKFVNFQTIHSLLYNEIHECRLLAVIILTLQYKAAKDNFETKFKILDFYVTNRSQVNNWDIVDSSTHKILGPFVHETNDFALIDMLSDEPYMWSKRMAVVAFWYLFKQGHYNKGLEIIHKNLTYPHDLMHKANGWMLRELWKYSPNHTLQFIDAHYDIMPRTTLRYAIEKLDPIQRKSILDRNK